MTFPSFLGGRAETRAERLFEHWLGPAPHPDVMVEPELGVPRELLDHHRIRQRWGLADSGICRWIPPKYAYPDEHSRPDITVFLMEQEGVQSWGVDADGAVWTRIEEESEAWTSLPCGLTDFLLGYELVEVAMGASVGPGATSSWVPRAQVDAIVAPLTPLSVPIWMMLDSPHRLHGNDDAVALVGPNPFGGETPDTASGWEVFVAGRRPGSVDWLADVEGVVGTEGWHSPEQLESYGGIVWDSLRLR